MFTVGELTAETAFSAGVLTAAAWIDLRKRIVPNPLLLTALGFRVFLWLAESLEESCFWEMFFADLWGAGLTLLSLFLLGLLCKGGLGMGDIKLLSVLALFLPLDLAGLTFLYGLCLASLPSLWWLLLKRKKSKDTLPFVPFLWLGYWWALLELWA